MSATATRSWIEERVSAALDRFNRGDAEGVVELCDPDVEFTTFLGRFEGRTYRGHDGVREWFRNIFEAFPGFQANVQAVEAVDGVGIVAIEFQGTGAASGISLEQRIFQRIEFRDRLAVRWSWHPTREAALGAGESA